MGLIYLDTCLLIYLVEAHPDFGPKLRAAMTRVVDARFAISPMVKLECLVAPQKRGDPVLQRGYESLFLRFENLLLPETVFLQAAQLRARFGLRTPDALHLACAQYHACDALWTNDERFTQGGHGLARNVFHIDRNTVRDKGETVTKLESEKRNRLGASTFAFPKQRKEPLEDAKHVRNAIARFDQVKEATDAERDAAWKRIVSAAKKFGVDVKEKSWRELGKGKSK